MSAIERYKKAAYALREAEYFVGLIGKPYHGGGGGVGKVFSGTASLVAYHQPRDGDKNYHDSPVELNAALVAAIRANASTLLEQALNTMRTEAEDLALKAHAEHAELMAAAGLTPSQQMAA